MQKIISIKLLPSEAADEIAIRKYIAHSEAVKTTAISGFTVLKQYIDATGKQAWVTGGVCAFINEPFNQR